VAPWSAGVGCLLAFPAHPPSGLADLLLLVAGYALVLILVSLSQESLTSLLTGLAGMTGLILFIRWLRQKGL
jgi:Flp pilus assembly protein TadB